MKYLRAVSAVAVAICMSVPGLILAEDSAAIEKAIAEHQTQIDQLNKDIAQYQVQLDQTSVKKQTLQNTVSQLNLSIKKVSASVNITKNQISSTQLEIQKLEQGIVVKTDSIDTDEAGLAESIRRLNEIETRSMAAQMLSSGTFSVAWQDADTFQTLQGAVHKHIDHLAQEKQQLNDTKTARESKQKNLLNQKATLVTQQGSLNATKKAQGDLLVQTKSQESTYQKIIAEKKAQERSFEDALGDLKLQLQVSVDQSAITPSGKGVLRWPVDKVRVTQYFGNTAFAASGAYHGKGHNGIDLAASIGTPIKAAMSGTVVGAGNTDAIRGCYSFGKWVMVKHSNGLSTMYAHLSQINVSSGQAVETGDMLGYSGETGYATGPHLHFGVYVSSATQILRLGDATKSATPCAGAVMPVGPLEGYLNPLNYL